MEREDTDVALEGVEAWVEREVRLEEDEFVPLLLKRREMAGTRDVFGSSSSSTSVVPSSSSCPGCSIQSCSI